MLTSSSDNNYVPDEHEDFDQYDPYHMYTIQDNAILKPPCKYGGFIG